MMAARTVRAAFLIVLLLLVVPPPHLSATPPSEALADLDALVEKAMRGWNIPGMALAIVRADGAVDARGFGYRDVDQKLPVTPDTLFAIASNAKTFTTFLIGQLVDEGTLDWDAPVRTRIPGFEMSDEFATQQLTLRDMVTHRSGLPRHDLVWYRNSSLSRRELVRRLRFRSPTAPCGREANTTISCSLRPAPCWKRPPGAAGRGKYGSASSHRSEWKNRSVPWQTRRRTPLWPNRTRRSMAHSAPSADTSTR